MQVYHAFILFPALLTFVSGHGRLMDPPNRSSIWRIDPKMPMNIKDDQLWCGGYNHGLNGGKCGVCGDDYAAPHPQPNENTGIYGSGRIVATYQSGEMIEVTSHITANHLGDIQYHLCKMQDSAKPETGEECFELLKFADGSDRKTIDEWEYVVHSHIQLPEGLTCEHCVLRWTYNGGNFWGPCDASGNCGQRVTFRSCSDIAIV